MKSLLDNITKAMETAEVAWWEMRLPSGALRFGENKARILGYDPEDFKHYTDFTKLVDPADAGPMYQAMRDHLDGKTEVYEALFRIKAKDGSWFTYYDRGKIVDHNPENIIVTGITTNVATINGYLYAVMTKPYEPIQPGEL